MRFNKDFIDNNPVSIFGIFILTIICIYGIGYSTLNIIYLNDAIHNEDYLNNNIDTNLEESLNFYIFTTGLCTFTILVMHLYLLAKFSCHVITLLSSYGFWISLFSIIYISAVKFGEGENCKTRVLVNCSNPNIDNKYIKEGYDSLTIALLVCLIKLIITDITLIKIYNDDTDYKIYVIKIFCSLVGGLIMVFIPMTFWVIIFLGEVDFSDFKSSNTPQDPKIQKQKEEEKISHEV